VGKRRRADIADIADIANIAKIAKISKAATTSRIRVSSTHAAANLAAGRESGARMLAMLAILAMLAM